jgi:hypothetical protein
MYDLSWLNPTPHAIAVYASQPLSPVATHHLVGAREEGFGNRMSAPGKLVRSSRWKSGPSQGQRPLGSDWNLASCLRIGGSTLSKRFDIGHTRRNRFFFDLDPRSTLNSSRTFPRDRKTVSAWTGILGSALANGRLLQNIPASDQGSRGAVYGRRQDNRSRCRDADDVAPAGAISRMKLN